MQGATRTTLLTDDEAEMVVTACHALAERLRAGRDGDPHIRKVSRKSADSYDRLARRFQTARGEQFVRQSMLPRAAEAAGNHAAFGRAEHQSAGDGQ